jgi:hypothetical protein
MTAFGLHFGSILGTKFPTIPPRGRLGAPNRIQKDDAKTGLEKTSARKSSHTATQHKIPATAALIEYFKLHLIRFGFFSVAIIFFMQSKVN